MEYTQMLSEPQLISGLGTLLKDEDPLVIKRTIRVFANVYRHSLNMLATGELDEPTFSNAWPTVSSISDELIGILEHSENEGITVHIVRFLEAAVLSHILADITRYPHVLSKTSPTISKIVFGLLNLLDTDYVGGSAFIVGTRAMITVACYKEDLRKEVIDLIEKKIAKPAATLFDHHIRSLNKMLQRNLFRLLRREQSHKEKERLIEMMVKVGVKRRLLAGWAPVQSHRKRSAPSQLSTDDIIGRTTPPHKKKRGGDTPPRSPEYYPSASQAKPEYIPTASQPNSQTAPEYIPTKIQKMPISQPNSRPNSQPNSRPNSQPNSRPNSRPNSPPNSQPNSRPNSRPNSPPNSRPNSPLNSRPNSPLNSQPNSPPNSRPNSPPKSPLSSHSGRSTPDRVVYESKTVEDIKVNSLPNSPRSPLSSHSGRSTPDRIVNNSKTDDAIKVNFDLLQKIINSSSKKYEESSIEVIAKALERPQAVEFVLEYMDQLQDIPDEDLLMNQLREVGSDENAKKETLAALLVKILPNNVIDKLKEQNETDEVKTETTSQSVSTTTSMSTSSPVVHTAPDTSSAPLFSSQDVDLRSFLNPKGGDVDMRMFDPRNMQQQLNPNDPRMSRSILNQASYRDPRSKPSELALATVAQTPSRDPRNMTNRDPRRPVDSRDPRVVMSSMNAREMSRSPNFITERNLQDVDRRSPNFMQNMPDMGRSPNFMQNAQDMNRRSPNFLQNNERNYLGGLDPRIRNERVPLVNCTVQNYNHGVPLGNFSPNTVPRFNGMNNVNSSNMQNNIKYNDRNHSGPVKNNNALNNNNQNGWGQSPPQSMVNRAAMRMSAS